MINHKVCHSLSNFGKRIDNSNVKKQVNLTKIVAQWRIWRKNRVREARNLSVAKDSHFWYTREAMIKTIDVAGIRLDNYTVREAIMNLEREMSDQGFHTIEEVNTDTLMLAASDDTVRQALMILEHTVIAETGILEAVGASNYQRKHEIEHHDFFHELMRRLERGRKRIYLIGDTQERTDAMLQHMEELYPRCSLVGSAMLEGWDGTTDAVINDINSATPDVVISILPSPQQERFLLENRDKLFANLWYGMGTMGLSAEKKGIVGFFRRYIRTYKLEKQIHSYGEGRESV